MARKKSAPRDRSKKTAPASRPPAAPADDRAPTEEELQGPPPREALLVRSDREREAEREASQFSETSPELAGGDVDADWQRAASVGEEAPGGTVATPDQSIVDEYGEALGVPRAPEEEVRTSQEILEQRDRYRWEQEAP
jgi:hypothetical protein